jgi:SAM-dependent methyltransferase
MNDNFEYVIDKIFSRSPLQKKKIESYLSSMDASFFQEAETFVTNYLSYLNSQNISLDYAIESYLDMIKTMMRCQIAFSKTGQYPISNSKHAVDDIYSNDEKMKSYMFGLALSQFLWKTHYQIFKFFQKKMNDLRFDISSYLEVGPGHGLFLNQALDCLKNNTKIIAIDISPACIWMTRSIMAHFHPIRSNDVIYHIQDMLQMDLNEKIDFIALGEVLEHVNNPDKLLIKLFNLLSDTGHAFISTCVNCPAIDHVYHFRTIEEIKQLINDCGFQIEDELVLPVEDLSMEEIVNKRITINYCAIAKKI